MADTDIEPLANGTGPMSEEEAERMKQRPADIDADVREMERRKRVEALMSSKLFREELERVLDQQLHEGGDAPLLQRIKEMVGGRLHSGSFRGPSCVLPINDIRGIEGVGYEKGEKILRCKLAAAYRLVDLFGWTQTGLTGQITARLNTAIEQVLTTPRGVLPHEVTASSLVKVDMQGTVVDQGTTNFPVNVEGFSVHGMVHAARPDLRCVLHVRAPAALAVSAMKKGLLPLCTEAALLGEIAYHHMPYGSLDNEEQEKLVRALGPHAKILILTSAGALCCGATLEEAFFNARNLTAACDVQLRLSSIPLDDLTLIDEEAKRQIYEQSRKAVASEKNWRVGGEEFEALMRMLDNAGFRTGYVYRHPLIKNDVPRPKNDVEVPPAVSSLGYLLEEEELYRQGLWKKGHGKAGERTRWLNSPNVYQKVEVLETGTNDPKKITKWVDANNEEWVQDSSPQHSSTPVKIDTLQFVPKNTNPKEFKKLQQLIKDNRRADKITSGPQSHILEGVTWDEAAKLVGEDAANTNTGDHVVLMGAASKGIIQRGYQHNATMYSAPYARNPFDHVSDSEIADYRRIVERKQRSDYDTDVSESEPLSGAVLTSPLTETDGESHDEHRVLRIETKKVPVRSQPEIVLSDDFLNSERAHADRTKDDERDPNLLPDDEVFSSPVVSPIASPMVSPVASPMVVRTQHNVIRGTLIQEGTLTQDPNSTLTEALNSNQRSIHEYSRTTNFENVIKKFNSPDSASKHSKYQNPRDPNETAVDIVAASINSVSIGVANSELDDVTLFEARVANSVVNTVKVDFDPVVHFARVRERFNSPENFEVKKMTCHSCSLEKIESPVYEHVKKFTMMSASNVQKGVDVHPKCKVSLTARLSGEKPVSNAKLDKNDKKTDGHYLRRDENENQKLANAPKITDQDKSDTQKFILKNSSSLSGLAKLACEIKNDAINLNSKIAIETLNSKLASESSSDGYDSLKSNKEKELYSYALDLYNPGNNSPRSSLYSIPSIDWDGRCKSDYTFRTRSLPRQRSNKQHRLYRTQSHSGFINAHLKDPEPNHFHLPRCNSCGATNVSYTWELIKEDLNSIKSGRKTFKVPTSLYRSVDDIHQNYFDEATKVKVTKKVFPVYKVTNLDVEFEESQEFTEDNYIGDIGNSFSSDNQTVIEKVVLVDQNTTITEETLNYDASTDKKEVDEKYECDKLDGNRDENESKDQDIKVKYDYQSKADISQFETAQRCTDAGYITGATKEKDLHRAELVQIVNEEEKNIETDNTISTEGEYHSFTDEMDFDTSYVSPVKELVEKDIRDYSVPMDMYFEDYKKRISPSKSPKSPNRREVIPASPRGVLEPILEESKSSYGDDSGNMSNVDGQKSSVDTSTEKSKDDSKTEIGTDSSIESKGIRKEEIIYKHLEPDTPIIDEESNTEFELDIPTPKTEKASNEDLGDQNISVEISLKPQYDKLHEIIEKTVTTIYQSSENEDSDDDIITEKKKIVSTVTIDDKTSSVTDVQSMVQDIITTAVTASKLKTEISLSSCHKITREILQTEYLQRDSYFLAEEEDTTTNDIESVSTNAVQTAIDVYTEEHDVEVTDPDQIDMLDCVYNNVFEILSEEAISAQIEMKLDDGDIENKIIANHKKKKNESSLDGLKEKLCERVIPDNIDTQHFGATKKSFTEESATEKYDSNKIKTLTLEVDTPCEKSSEDGLAIVDDMKSEEVLADVIIKDRISAFEYSTISSSVGGLRSFDSTVEFEMYEVVSDVMWTIINKIDFQVQQNSCEIFNGLPKEQKVSFDFETKIIDAANITVPATCLTYEEQENFESLENIEFNPEAESLNNSDQKIEPPSFQVESEDVLKEITTFDFGGKTESTHSVIIEMPLDIQDVKAGISETDTQEPEISEDFSIAKIIQDMELNLNLNETVLTESSEMDLSPAQRIAEALIYYIFDRTFCLITKKMKLQKSKQIKKVITVVETEDILLTAMSLWTVESLECTKSISDDVDIPSSETSLVAEQLFETQALSPHKLTVDDTSTMSPENDDQNSINDKHSLKILMDEVLDEVETCLNNDSEPIATSSEFHEIDTTPVTVVECKVSTKFEMKTHSIISLNVDPTYDNNLHENEAAPSNDEHESNLSEKQFEVSTELNSDNQLNFDDIQKNIAAELNPSEETDDNVSMNNFEIFYKDHHFNSPAESETDFSVNADIEIHDKNYVDREIFDSEESDNEDMNAKVLAIHMYDRNANKDYFAFGHSSKYDMDVEVSNADFDADFQPIIYEENVTGCPTTPHNNTKPEEGFETEIDIHHVCERGETIASDHSFKLDLPLDISGICDAESQCCDENEYPTSFYFPRNTSTEVNSEKNSQEDSHITLDLHSSELNDTTNLDFESGLSGIEINNNSGSRTSIDPNETFLNTTYNIEDKLNQIVCEDDSTEENRSSFEVAKEIVSDIMDKSLLDHCKPTCKHCKELVIHSSNESECSNRTFILEGSSSDMNTAFVVDSPEPDEFYSRSSSPHKEISVFVKCGESPIRNVSNSFVSEASALVDDDTLYEKHDAILGSPFLKQAPVISMSQTVNAGGVKYWISFDNSLTENVKKNYGYRRVRKFDDGNLKVPSFITMNFKDLKNEEGTSSCAEEKTWPVHDKEFKPTSVLLDGIDFNKSNETKTEESYTTYVSTDYHTCESDFNNSKTEKKLLYDTRIDLHTKAVRRQYNSWPPFEDTVFYKIISKFRMSESFDSKDMEHAKIDNSI